MYKLVCVVGMPGAGKSCVGKIFSESGFSYLRFGQITIDLITERKWEQNSENERKVREEIRNKSGMGAYAILSIPKIDALLRKGNAIVDGLYSWSEYKILKEKYGSRMVVMAVYAPPSLRYKRLSSRTDVDEKLINRLIPVEEAQQRDYAEIENIEKGGPIVMADYTILNIGSKEEFEKNVKKIMKFISL
ncbi:AAA family ATPase [Candidatus Woesearchaeota archaeon]|nr:AAA family ATPase [Candidatus Woesearchaeota archaeon]